MRRRYVSSALKFSSPASCPSNTVLAPPHAPSSKTFALCVVALLFWPSHLSMSFKIGCINFGQGMKENSKPRHFASDNYAGICPEAFAALAQANTGHEVSYGDDAWTAKASDLIRDVFETKCEVFLVFNGTSANSLSLASLCQPYHSILCHEIAHVEVSECGAPEFFANGTKVLLLPGESGKIEPAAIERTVTRRTDIHYPKPRALTLTQATEVGTVYTPDELKALWGVARKFGLRV